MSAWLTQGVVILRVEIEIAFLLRILTAEETP